MFEKIGNGFQIMRSSIRFIFSKPLTLIPVLLVWGIYTGVVVYVLTTVNFNAFGYFELFGILFLFLFLFSFLVSLSSLILLELLEQNELEGRMSIWKAIGDAFTRDLWRTMPIIIGWSIIKFLIALVEILISAANSKRNGRRSRGNRALDRTLSVFKQGIRMGVMLILPAIAWEDVSTKEAYHKGKHIYKRYFASVAAAVGISRVIGLFLGLPLIIFIFLISNGTIQMGDWVSYVILFYAGFTWSFGILVEQLFTAELYLWYKKYEMAVEEAERNNQTPPTSIQSVPKPSFLDDVPDLVTDRVTDYQEKLEY